MADVNCLYVEGCGVSSAEYSVHLVGVHRLSACGDFCGVHSWQDGTRCRDGVKLLWCHSHLVWLVFEGPIPTCTGFHLENFFVTSYICTACSGSPQLLRAYAVLSVHMLEARVDQLKYRHTGCQIRVAGRTRQAPGGGAVGRPECRCHSTQKASAELHW